jgi:hypothetical protein
MGGGLGRIEQAILAINSDDAGVKDGKRGRRHATMEQRYAALSMKSMETCIVMVVTSWMPDEHGNPTRLVFQQGGAASARRQNVGALTEKPCELSGSLAY